MNSFSALVFITGFLLLIFHKIILKIQGPSKKTDWPMEVRKRKLIVGGIALMFAGLFLFLSTIFKN